MQSNQEKYAQKMCAAGVCDERGAAFCATAVKLPNGAFGMCLLGVKGNELSIYDTDMKSNAGELLYVIPLKDVSGLTINEGFLAELLKGCSLKFTYQGFTYTFKNCWQQKQALAVIRTEAQ